MELKMSREVPIREWLFSSLLYFYRGSAIVAHPGPVYPVPRTPYGVVPAQDDNERGFTRGTGYGSGEHGWLAGETGREEVLLESGERDQVLPVQDEIGQAVEGSVVVDHRSSSNMDAIWSAGTPALSMARTSASVVGQCPHLW